MTDPEPYLTPDDIRDLYPMFSGDAAEAKFPDALIEKKIHRFEDLAERARGVAYRSRTFTQTITAGRGPLLLAKAQVSEITDLSYNYGTAPTVPDGVEIVDGYSLLLTPWGTSWPCGTRITLEGLHGFTEPPQCILDGCALFVRCELTADQSNAPANAISYTDPVTGYSLREGTADWGAGRFTKWIGVNDAINEAYDYRIPGIA